MEWRNIFWIMIGIIVGEAALAILTTVAQEVVFDGISYTESPAPELLAGGLLTFLAAVIAGLLARIAGKVYTLIIPFVISLLIVAETTYLIITGWTTNPDPLWFEILAGASLIAGIWLGYHYRRWLWLFSRRHSQPQPGGPYS